MAEYRRFGESFVKREDDTEEWQECPMDDVPPSYFVEERVADERRRLGYDPFSTEARVTFLPNPAMEAVAEELGLTLNQLRGRLNGEPGGPKVRVSEDRFDEIAEAVGLTPEEARRRFAE